MLFCIRLTALLGLCVLSLHGRAQHSAQPLESLINQHVSRYALSASNRFRLAAYLELKGEVAYSGELNLNFGPLGSFAFYPDNCLLRTEQSRIYHITPQDTYSVQVQALNDALDQLFERIDLLSNGQVASAHVQFVDQHLAQKNLDSFHKLYVRYLLIHYGSFDPVAKRVSVRTANLRKDLLLDEQAQQEPLLLILDTLALHGSYLRTGGLVYVRDVDRKVAYATGEEVSPNVGAFKLFLSRFLGKSVLYLLQHPGQSVAKKGGIAPPAPEPLEARQASSNIEPLYHEYSWIPMMLGMLRSRGLSFGDPDIVQYFVDAPYFDRICAQLTPEERRQVERYMKRR